MNSKELIPDTEIKHKILIVRVGRVGDMVMITAALNAILDNFKQAEVHLLTSSDGKRVLNNFNHRVTQFYIYNRKSLLVNWLRYKLRKLIGLENYTHIFCFETNPGYLKLFTRSKAVIHVNEHCVKEKNYAWHCLQTVNRVTHQDINKWVSLTVTADAIKQSADMFLANNIDKKNYIVGIHPSFSALKKNKFRSQRDIHERGWPEKNWAELAQALMQYGETMNIKIHVIMDLLEEDRALGERIVELSNNAVTLIIPSMNFERYKATLQSMDLLITPNTGPMHVAGALGTQMVALFSVESPDNCGPYVSDEQYTALCAEAMLNSERGLSAIMVDTVFNACIEYIH